MRLRRSAIRTWIAAAKLKLLLPAAFVVCIVHTGECGDEVAGPFGFADRNELRSSVHETSEEWEQGQAALEDEPDNALGGWIAQGFTWNPAAPRDRYNGPVSFNDRANEYQLNQLYVFFDRPARIDAGRLSLGFRADAVFGTDAFQFHSYGFDDRIVSDRFSTFYKLAFPQFYLELPLPFQPDASVRLGKWYSPLGYESGLAAEDFFYSHPLAFNVTPFTHTGILLDYPLTDRIGIELGLHRGMDVWEGDSSSWGFACGVNWTSQDERTSAGFGVGTGPDREAEYGPQDGDGLSGPNVLINRYQLAMVGGWLEHQFTERFRYVFNFDIMQMEDEQQDDDAFSEVYAFTQSVFYEWSERITGGARLELLRDDDGQFIAGFRSLSPPASGTYTNLTLGLNVRCGQRAVLRPEVRWDWQNRDDPSDAPAFRDARSDHQFLFATDLVVVF